MKTVCKEDMCNGCKACVDICPKNAISIRDSLRAYNAIIDTDKCVSCKLCTNVCPNNNPVNAIEPIEWKQGWAKKGDIRKKASSGGVATAIATSFIQSGGICCSCVFKDGEFVFEFIDSTDDVVKFSGSKYVKSNPQGIYKNVACFLKEGKKVLFIGLPCQVAALKNFIKANTENLYTIDLICHGSPSPELLKMFLDESGVSLTQCKDIQFREKTNFYFRINQTRILPPNVSDTYTYSFLQGLTYTENCYHCQYAKIRRVSDITLGDSWGSDLAEKDRADGISLVLCQNKHGLELLSMSDIQLAPVDKTIAIQNNRQLRAPSQIPKQREKFFNTIKKQNKFSKSVEICFPVVFLKQKVKKVLFKLHFKKQRKG